MINAFHLRLLSVALSWNFALEFQVAMREPLGSMPQPKFLQRFIDQLSRTITMKPTDRNILRLKFSLEQLLEISQN
jgi:hypothetical protein